MKDIKTHMFENFLLENGFYRDESNNTFNSEGTCYTVEPEKGEGCYWVYTYDDLFAISILDFVFYEDYMIEYPQPQYIDISYYHSIAGEELMPCRKAIQCGIKGHCGRNDVYRAIYQKEIPIRSTGILLMPAYYEEYLKDKFPKEYENPSNDFIRVNGSTDFPELIYLLQQITHFRGTGIAAKLYYESKVAEAISLIVQKAKETPSPCSTMCILQQDLDSLSAVNDYIDNYFCQEISLDTLAKIACMGKTKLKYMFKEVYHSTIFEYIHTKRMHKAKYLLTNTDLYIKQIAQIVGYKKPSSFSEAFHKRTGILPNEFRKISNERSQFYHSIY